MLRLLWKDILTQKRTFLILIAILVAFLLLNDGISFMWLGIWFSIVVAMNTFNIDEKANIQTLLNSLPYTRREIVSSKYIGALVFTVFNVCFIYIGDYLINGSKELFVWKEMLLIVGIVLLAVSFMFPFSFKFKSQYLLTGVMVSFVVYMVLANIFALNDKVREFVGHVLALSDTQLFLYGSGIILVIYLVSWLLSIRIYQRKAF